MLAVLMIAGLVGAVIAATLFGTTHGLLGALIAAPAGAGILTLAVGLLIAARLEPDEELDDTFPWSR